MMMMMMMMMSHNEIIIYRLVPMIICINQVP